MLAFARKLFGDRSGKRETALIMWLLPIVLYATGHTEATNALWGVLAYNAAAFGLEGFRSR